MSNKGLFPELHKKIESKYTSSIVTPIYEPTMPIPPKVHELYDLRKYRELIKEIEDSNISEKDKTFLKFAATRHVVFNYQNIAEYYCHASKELQELMENSALVILDFNKAFEDGYVQLARDIAEQYFDNYGE